MYSGVDAFSNCCCGSVWLFALGCTLSSALWVGRPCCFLSVFPVKWLWAELVHILLHHPVDLCFCGICLVKGSSEASALWGGSRLLIRHLMPWKALSSSCCLLWFLLPARKTLHSETPQIVGHLDHVGPGGRGRSVWTGWRSCFPSSECSVAVGMAAVTLCLLQQNVYCLATPIKLFGFSTSFVLAWIEKLNKCEGRPSFFSVTLVPFQICS